MSNAPNVTPEQLLGIIFQSIKVLGDAFWKLSGRVDALKETVCELHPGVEKELEGRIQKAQNDSAQEFASLQQMLELLGAMAQGPLQ